jgi:hypothetical protein
MRTDDNQIRKIQYMVDAEINVSIAAGIIEDDKAARKIFRRNYALSRGGLKFNPGDAKSRI